MKIVFQLSQSVWESVRRAFATNGMSGTGNVGLVRGKWHVPGRTYQPNGAREMSRRQQQMRSGVLNRANRGDQNE